MSPRKRKSTAIMAHSYRPRAQLLPGSNFTEVAPQARRILHALERRTKRQPYIRSKYFRGQKIFLSLFWPHLSQKPLPEQGRRLKFLPCAIELLQESRFAPISKPNID